MTTAEIQNAAYLEMLAAKKAAKSARAAKNRAKAKEAAAESKAFAAERTAYVAAQVGPFLCIVCKSEQVEKFDCMCPKCHAEQKRAAEAWYANKPSVVGTF